MKIGFIIPHLSHGSPGSFYRPYEIAKRLVKFQIEHTFYSPFKQDVVSYKDVSMQKIPGFSENHLNSLYSILRKLIYNPNFSKFIPYDKMVKKLSMKIANGIEKDIDLPDIFQGELIVGGLASVILAKKFNKKSIIDIHNIWGIELVEDRLLKKDSSQFKKLMELEKYVIDNSDGVIVVNQYMKDFIIKKFNAESKKIVIIPPGGENLIKNNIKDVNSKRFLDKKIIHAGLVNKREHVDLFIKSIPFIQKKYKNLDFVISKQGEEVQKIRRLSNSLSIKPSFYWYESRKDARNFFNTCYIGVLPSNNNISRKLGTPLKLLEYMSMGLPVIANDVGSWSTEIKQNNWGLLSNDDPDDFASKIMDLIEDKNMYEKIQNSMLHSIEHEFNWDSILKNKLIPFYNKFIYS